MDPKRSLRAWMRARSRRVGSLVYQPQVKFEFPLETVDRLYRSLPPPPPGYLIRSLEGPADYAPWAALLDEEGRFGTWNIERIRTEVVPNLIAPDAAVLVFHGSELVGCAHTCRLPSRRGKHGMGMYLHLRKAHRGTGPLASILTFKTLWFFVREGYDRTIATTDPWRLSALFIYLREGAHPVKDSLCSHWQWYRIERRLRPTLVRWRQSRERAAVPRA